MNETEILTKLNEILLLTFNRKANIQNDLTKDGILDSMEIIDFIVEVEKQFNINIPGKEIAKFQLSSIKNLISYLQKKGV